MKLNHLGAESTVTGSCHLLQTQGLNILIDCGMTQGADTARAMDQWPVSPSAIDFLFLTHAHIDHIGRVPELIQRGFTGEIICTHGTRALLEPMLEDALRFTQLSMNRDEKERLLSSLEELSWGFEYQESFSLRKGIRFTLRRAGHILGSCWIRFELPGGKSVVFSGDLGAENTPILPDPDIPEPCDLLVLESTYGDRCHEDRSRRVERLARILKKALADRGKVLIPAFALGKAGWNFLIHSQGSRWKFRRRYEMSGVKYLLDTNFILGILKSNDAVLADVTERRIKTAECGYNAITRMELLGFQGITKEFNDTPHTPLISQLLICVTVFR